MTAINTNTAALNAQYYLAKSNKDMESSMAKLSSGQKVNSAADDAAGLAIASRMTAQIRGLAMAVKNSNDSMSLAQTAEGAMEEVTNMLQRIRELAVQSSNGTMNSSDRASLDAEVQALKAEIDRVATTTTFNSQNLLDGSYKATFQIGDKGGQTVGLQIGSVLTSSLGMGEGSSGANSVVSARVNLQNVDAGDIVINGQALGAISANDHMEDVVQNINDNVDNVKASAFNVVVAENVGNGITGGNGVAASGNFSKTFTNITELAVGDVIEVNGTDVTLQAATVADLETRLNAVTSTTGLTATADGNNITLVGDNVTSLSIGYKTKAEIEAGFNSSTTTEVDVSGNASDALAFNVVLDSSDAVAGRTYELAITAAGTASGTATDATVTYTAVSGDTNQDIMRGLRNALLEHSGRAHFTGAANVTIDVESAAGTMTFAKELDYGKSTITFGVSAADINNALGAAGNVTSDTIPQSGMVITVTEQGVGTATTFTISASSSMEELVENINAETGGVVTANVNDDGKLVLSNSTGAAITIEDDSTSGSGFSSTATTFNGFLKLEGLDDEPIRITKGNKGLASVGNEADIASIGFREVTADTLSDGYTMIGAELTNPATALAQGDLSINGVEIFDTEITVNSLSDKLTLINSKAAETGVTASAFFSKSFVIDESEMAIGDTVEINGTDVTLQAATVADLVTRINAVTSTTGITASANGSNVTLEGENVQSVTTGYKTKAEIEAGFNSATTTEVDVSSNASDALAVNVVLNTADAVAGRTYELAITAAGTASGTATDATVTYTAVSGDTNQDIMRGLRNALLEHSGRAHFTGAANVTIDVESAAGTMTFAKELDYGKSTITFGVSAADINNVLGGAATHNARLKLDSVNNSPIKIDLGQNTSAANHANNHGLLESGVGAADFDVNEPTLSAAGGTSMSGLTVTDAASATKALGTIDNAIDTVNSIRGDLGALQNRLEYTINNLSSISNATTGARGRILDADFAKTTSELTKHQILTQAATSMLAQANQSKQGILALLQG